MILLEGTRWSCLYTAGKERRMKHIRPLSKAAANMDTLEIIQLIVAILSALAPILSLINKNS